MDKVSTQGFLLALGLMLMIVSPIAIVVYVLLTGTLGVLGIILASAGTLMVVNFYNVKDDTYRLIGLLVGPALVAIGLYFIINF